MVTRNDLYLCAKAMGNWTQNEGEYVSLLSLNSWESNGRVRSESQKWCYWGGVFTDIKIHITEVKG